VADDLPEIAADVAARAGLTAPPAVWSVHLAVLASRVVFPGGLTAASRHCGAEPWLTERPQPYHERTLRRTVGALAAGQGAAVLEAAVERQVHAAVLASDHRATLYSDLYDQVYYTKKLAHAGPIGNLGNRILACTYVGLTFLRLGPDGPSLAYHISWHKPASPLVDALQDLDAPAARAAWLRDHVWLAIWDRGANGRAVLQWALGQPIPYLTLSSGTVYRSAQKAPTLATPEDLPVFVRRDVRLAAPPAATAPPPRTVIYPAQPAKGAACKQGIRYRTNAPLAAAEVARTDDVYTTRWAACENRIKDLCAVGFGVNRERRLEPTTSRGQDGQRARLTAREDALDGHLAAAAEGPPTARTFRRIETLLAKRDTVQAAQDDLAGQPVTTGARPRSAPELIYKYLHVLVTNALLLLLTRSPIDAVRHLTLAMVRELLLGRRALAVADAAGWTLWVEPVPDARQRRLQAEVIRLFDAHVPFRLRGQPARLRLAGSPGSPSG
jgi:hypothetical protein